VSVKSRGAALNRREARGRKRKGRKENENWGEIEKRAKNRYPQTKRGPGDYTDFQEKEKAFPNPQKGET